MRPEFGCGVHDFVFDSIDANTIGRMEDGDPAGARALGAEDHGARPSTFDLSQAGNGLLTIDIGYQVRATNTERNLVYPFYVIPAEEIGVRLPEIELDDRRFQDLVSEARMRISRSCPEWTEHNVSDPGITLIELFAWMTGDDDLPAQPRAGQAARRAARPARDPARRAERRDHEPALPARRLGLGADRHPGRRHRGRHAAHGARGVGDLPGRRGLHDPADAPRRLRAPAPRAGQGRRPGRRRGTPAGLRPARVRHAAAGRRRALPRLRGPARPPDHADRGRRVAGARRGRQPRGPAAALGGLPVRRRVGRRARARGPHGRLQLRIGHRRARAAGALASWPRSAGTACTGCAAGSRTRPPPAVPARPIRTPPRSMRSRPRRWARACPRRTPRASSARSSGCRTARPGRSSRCATSRC